MESPTKSGIGGAYEGNEARHGGGPIRQLPFDGPPAEPRPAQMPFDPLRLVDAVLRRWYLWIGAGLLLGALCFTYCCFKSKTVGSLQLVRRDNPLVIKASDAGDVFQPQQFSDTTLLAMIHSPELYQRVSDKTQPRISVRQLASELSVAQLPDSQIIDISYSGRDTPEAATNLLNLMASEIVQFTQEMQVREGNEMAQHLTDKLAGVDHELAATEKQIDAIPIEQRVVNTDEEAVKSLDRLNDLDLKYEMAKVEMDTENPIAAQLQQAQNDLAALRVQYTDKHPKVQDQLAHIKALEQQLAASSQTKVNGQQLPVITEKNRTQIHQMEEYRVLRDKEQLRLQSLTHTTNNYSMLKSRYDSLRLVHNLLASHRREALLDTENALGFYRIFHEADMNRVSTGVNWRKGVMLSVAATFFGMILMAGFVALVEVIDPRIKTTADLERATKLPILGTLGDLETMDDAARRAWAFRTWTIIKGKISETQNHSLVCGVISARHGEGRSTWVDLLATTAHERGLRVLCATTQKTDDPAVHPHEPLPDRTQRLSAGSAANGAPAGSNGQTSLETIDRRKEAASPEAFAFPMQATRQLRDSKVPGIVQIPLPGWVWNLERREQWQAALDEWQRIENLVLLVELPPASVPEGILLAENLPQVIWLAESGRPSTFETRRHLETLRHAGCQITGAVLNREPRTILHKVFARWIGAWMVLFLLTAAGAVSAQPIAPVPAAPTNAPNMVVYSGPQEPKPAAWQQHLTLGPGDVLDIKFYGETNLDKPGVVVGPDGRISYLQAHNITAEGLTVDELRDKLNNELGQYYRNPRVMIAPVAYLSKKYYILGRTVLKGAFVLDRPITIIEALARAHGLETGLVERNSVDLADLDHSFLERDGKRMPVDFTQLFLQGDFSQNVYLQPNDFLYFAPANLKEIYVIGQIRAPGPVPYTDHTTVIGAITERGGFTDAAWKNRVIVVRGSLAHPTVFTVNTWAILDGREADVRLQSRDIVYIANRPFIYGEELLDLAVGTFIQSTVNYWEGYNIRIIRSPILPTL